MELIFTLLLIVGGIECFFGYRIFRFLTAVIGFVVGAVIGGGLGMVSAGQAGALGFGLILGILGGLLAFKLYKFGVFIICFGAGAVLGGALGLASGDQGMILSFAGIAGLLLGVLGVILTKPIIIISTSVGGGMGAGSALGMLIQQPSMGLILGIVLAVAGILVQFALDKKKPAPDGEPEPAPEGEAGGLRLPGFKAAGAGESAGEGLKSAFASLKSGAAGLGQKVGAGAQGVANSQMVRQLRGSIDNTKTAHPLSGWNELARENSPLWSKGLPVVVTETRIVASPSEEGVRLALGFQNLSEQDILGVFFSVKCFDLLKQELEGIEKLAVQDFRLPSGGLWFSSQPFPLPDKDTRRVELTVKNVVFADGSIWNNETGAALTPTAVQPALELAPELSQELFRVCRAHVPGHDPEKIFRYQPREEADGWWCACGQLNTGAQCLACGMEQEALFDLIRPERLSQLREERIAEQKRLEEERRQKIAEQTEAAKQKAAEVSAKTAETLKKGLDKGAELGKQTGDALNKGLSRGAELSKQAGDRAKAFWAEKIEPNKRTIAIAACVFVAVLAVLLGTLFGLRAYRAGQEEKAQLQAQQEAEERRQKAEEERRAAQELAEWEAQFFFPYSDKEAIDESALKGMSEADLNLAKYEILARHGRVFSTPEYAQYFEGRPWYKPDSTFDENASGALTDLERANMDLFDAALAARRNARAAQALLDKLNEAPFSPYENDQFHVWDHVQPQNGTYFWTARSYEADSGLESVVFYWMGEKGPISNHSSSSGILTAKHLDMDKDGVPELLILRLTGSGEFGQAIQLEVWESDGAGGVKQLLMDTIDLSPVLPMGEPPIYGLSYVQGSERDYLLIEIGCWKKFYSAGLNGPAAEFYYFDGIAPFAPEEEYTDPVYEIDGRSVSEAEYRQTLEQWSQGAVLWGENLAGQQLPEVFYNGNYPLPAAVCGTIRLDMKAELEATRAYLTQLANK